MVTVMLALLFTSPARALTEIQTATQETSEPKFIASQQNGKASVTGLCIDILHAIERIEPDIKFIVDPEPQSLVRLEAALAADKLDAFCGMLRTRDRESRIHFVEPPLWTTEFYLAVRADDSVKINTWDDVRKLGDDGVILLISGHGSIKKLQATGGLKLDSSGKDPKTNIQKLLAGRGRFFFHRSPGIEREIRNAGAKDKVKLLPVVMDSQPLHMALSKTLQPDAAAKIRKAITHLHASGELKRLLDKWDSD